MKIGIMTFHATPNHGAALQAYALQTHLQKSGHDPFLVVLLAHDHDNFGEAIGAEVNLLLVGHTGDRFQICPPVQIGISFLVEKSKSANKSSFMRGLFDAGKTKMYVNRGIGTTHVPIRFFNRPETTLLAIRK